MEQPHQMNTVIEDRRRQLMREAHNFRLARLSQGCRPRRYARLLANLGGWLVECGWLLQTRYYHAQAAPRLPRLVSSGFRPIR